jgi:phosphotransferase system HPr (HPr) family protein
MDSVEIQVTNPSGLHARPATRFVETASRFQARVSVENLDRGSRAVDAKSILMLLTIGVVSGHRIRISADGPDADAAVEALRELVASGLGETTAG